MNRMSVMSVFVSDYDAAIEFCKRNVGLILAEDLPFGAQRWGTLRWPGDEVMSVALNRADSEGDRALVGKQGGSKPIFAIATDDCMAEYRRMKAAGVSFHGAPQVEPYGTGVT